MPEGQDSIYYATGESRSALENSPHMEAFKAKGYEVLFLTDPVDEVWVDSVPSFEEKPLVSIARGEVDLGGDDVDDDTKQGFEPLTSWMATTLSDDVKEVRLSHRLTTSAAVLVGDPGDLTPTLEKMYRAMGQELPKVKRTLELNPSHGLVTGLKAAYEAHAGRSRAGRHRAAAVRDGAAGRGWGVGRAGEVRGAAVQAVGEQPVLTGCRRRAGCASAPLTPGRTHAHARLHAPQSASCAPGRSVCRAPRTRSAAIPRGPRRGSHRHNPGPKAGVT